MALDATQLTEVALGSIYIRNHPNDLGFFGYAEFAVETCHRRLGVWKVADVDTVVRKVDAVLGYASLQVQAAGVLA